MSLTEQLQYFTKGMCGAVFIAAGKPPRVTLPAFVSFPKNFHLDSQWFGLTAAQILRPDTVLAVIYGLYVVPVGLLSIVFIPDLRISLFVSLCLAAFFAVRYFTLRYTFDENGIRLNVGWLFKQEVYLTYSKIQDIHLSQSILERFLGIGTIKIQNASATSGAEQRIVGRRDFAEIRLFIYDKINALTGDQDDKEIESGGGAEDQYAKMLSLLEQIAEATERLAKEKE